MATVLLFVVTVVTLYVACKRPPWFWTVCVGGPALLEVVGRVANFDVNMIPLGPVQMRDTDAAVLGVLVGVFYANRRRSARGLATTPMGAILAAIAAFILLKVTYSVLIVGDRIELNRSVSHAAGGLVAALGDVRDGLLPLFAPFYAYAVRESKDLKKLGWPIVVATGILLLKSAIGIAINGTIWTGVNDTDLRFINSNDAITLTIFSFMLPFLRVPRLGNGAKLTLAFFALATATIANHRSQWVGASAGLSILIVGMLFGRPFVRGIGAIRILLSGAAVGLATLAGVFLYLGDMPTHSPIVDQVSVRLLAVTDPARDPTAEWRQEMWRERLDQVGDNWPWGRPLGDRHEALVHGKWSTLPDHSAYVSTYELGGVILCVLLVLFWVRIVQTSLLTLIRDPDPEHIWPALVSIAVVAASLAYGSAYLFPTLGLAFALILASGSQAALAETPAPASSRAPMAASELQAFSR